MGIIFGFGSAFFFSSQDNVVLDGHHRLRACKELGLPVTYNVKNFTDMPVQELRYVLSVNLHGRHLDEFQRAEIGLKMDKIARQIAKERQAKTLFTSETGREAADRRFMPCASADTHGIDEDRNEDQDWDEEEERKEGEQGVLTTPKVITADR